MLAPSLAVLSIAAFVIGITSVVAQVLVPFAASLASDAERGQVVGTVMSGLLIGILLARTFSGFIGQVAGWHAVFGVAAVLMLVVIVLLWRELPAERRTDPVELSYGGLLASLGTLVLSEPRLRRRSIYGSLIFASFSVFWTSMAFMLARPPFGYSQAIIGLFGLAGVAGALCASVAGRLADRGLTRFSTVGFLVVSLASYGLLALGGHHVLALIVGIIFLDLGVQGLHITNQSEIYRLRPDARSRVTTVYMTSYFIGGAVGSATSALIFGVAGWLAVCLLGAGYVAVALLLCLTDLRDKQVPEKGGQ